MSHNKLRNKIYERHGIRGQAYRRREVNNREQLEARKSTHHLFKDLTQIPELVATDHELKDRSSRTALTVGQAALLERLRG